MSNNLKRMEKDLRTLAKRCKDIKYTRALLLSFLLMGMLSLAEVTSTEVKNTEKSINQTKRELNTSIGEMKSLFRQTRAANNKLLRSANLELIQLMEQGDHVVKSPWSSWQFGMGYEFNSQRKSYAGRKDKLEKYPYENIFKRETGENEINRYISPTSQFYSDIMGRYAGINDLTSASTAVRGAGNNRYGLAVTGPETDYPVPLELAATVRPRNSVNPRNISKNPAIVATPEVTTPDVPGVKSFSTPSPVINRVDIAQIQVDKITNIRGGTGNEAFILNSQKPNDPDYSNHVIVTSSSRDYPLLSAITQTSAIGGTINVHSKGDTYDMWTEGVTFKGVVNNTNSGGSLHEVAYTYTGDISRTQGQDYGKNWGTTRYPARYAAYAAMRTTSGQRMDIKDVTINYSGQEFVEDEPDPRFPQQYHFRRFLFYADLTYSYADTTINISEKTKINIDGNKLVMVGLVHAINRMGYNVGVYNQGRITTSARGKNNYIMSSVVFDQGPHPERLFFVNGEKGKITLNGEKDTFASLQTVGANQGASTIVNKGDIIFNGKGARGIISGINYDQSQTYFHDKNLEILLYKPMIFNGDNSIGMAFYYNRGNPYFEGGVNVFDQNDTSTGYDGTPNRVVQFPDKTLPSILKLRMNGKNSVGMLFEPIYSASDTSAEEVNPGGTSPNAPSGHKGLVDIVSTGDNSQLIYIKRGHINIKNPDSKLTADNTKKNTALYVNGEYYDQHVSSRSYVYERNVSLVTNEAKISMKNSEDSVGIYARGILKNLVSGSVQIVRDYVNNSRAKVTNTGEITITGKAVKGIVSDNANVTNTGKLILDGTQKNDNEGTVGLAALDGGYLKSTGTDSSIKVAGKSSIGLYVSRNKDFVNIGTGNTNLIVENTKVEANDGAVNVYSNGGTVTLGTTGSPTATVNLVTGNNALTFNNAFFYKDGSGNVHYDTTKNGKIVLAGKVKADIKEGGTVFYVQGNGGMPALNTFNDDVFNDTMGNLTLNMNDKSTLLAASNVTVNLSSAVGTPNFGGTSTPTITGSSIYKIYKLHKSQFNVDSNVNLDNANDAYNRIDVANSSVDIKAGTTIIGTKPNQNVIAQENPNTTNVSAIKLINSGTINLSGTGSSAIYGKFSEITNNGNITLGENSTALYGKSDSKIANNGTITLGNKSTGIFAADGVNNEVLNAGTITGTGNKAVGIVYDGTGAGARRINNTSTIRLSGENTIGIYAKGSNYIAENNGDIQVGNASNLNNPSIGMLTTVDNIQLKNNGNITGGSNAVGIYGINNIASIGSITTGDNSVGIYGKNNITSSGNITGGNDSFGIYGVNNITSSGNITTGENSTGIYGVNNITSSGNITGGNNSIGIYGTDNISGTGDITSGNGSVGIYSKGNGVTFRNISVGNDNSTGVYLENGGGTVIGNGNMTIGENSYGIVSNEGSYNFDLTSSGNVTLGNKGIYVYSSSRNGTIVNNADVTGTGNESYGLYTAGNNVTNNGNINLGLGIGNVGMYSMKGGTSRNSSTGIITIGASDIEPINMDDRKYAIGMAAGYRKQDTGNIINEGTINVNGADSIGMYATGTNSTAINRGTINLGAKGTIGMLLDEGARGKNEGIIQTAPGADPENVSGVIGLYAGKNSVLENTGTIHIVSRKGAGYFQARGGMIINRGTIILGRSGAAENEEEESGGPGSNTSKEVGNVRIKAPKGSPTARVYINGVEVTPEPVTVTEGERNMLHSPIGMYIDTLRKTNPIVGLDNVTSSADLIIGSEAASKTNSKAIEVSGELLEPYNRTIEDSSINSWNIYSGALTWSATATLAGRTGTINKLYMAKRTYSAFARDKDTTRDTYNFTEGLEKRYDKNALDSREKALFNKLNAIGNNEEILLYQAFDEMMGHQYANVQQRISNTGKALDREINKLNDSWENQSKKSNKITTFGIRDEYKTDTAGIINYTSNAYGIAYISGNETLKLGNSSGWYAGVIHNRFKFKDIGKSKENTTMVKLGLYNTKAFDNNGSLKWTISGEGFVSRSEMERRYLVVDEIFKAKSDYTSYGVAMKNEISKEFRTSERTSIKPYGSIKFEYGKTGKIKEKTGEVRLEIKDNSYYSIVPEAGIEFNYRQPFAKKATFTASLGIGYESELGKVNDRKNKARVGYTDSEWFNIRGEKEDRKGNFKTDLNIGIENTRFGVTINAGYDTKGENIRGGIGFRAIY